jgi:serine/threonine-protein kinase
MTMAIMHVQTPPTPPSERTELPIPRDLEQIVMKCLEKKPADRPASARQVAESLERCGIAPWTEDEAMAWWERHLPETSSLRTSAAPAPTEAETASSVAK